MPPPGSMSPGSGGYPSPGGPSSGPSTGLLVGLGLVVAGLIVAIVVVLVVDDGGSGDDEVELTAGDSGDEGTDSGDEGTDEGTDGGDEGDDTTVSGDDELDPEDIEEMDDEELAEADPFGMSAVVDDMVADLGGAIDEDDAECMLREAVQASIELGRFGDEAIEEWPLEDQVAFTSAMFSENCFEDPNQVLADIMAAGIVAEEGATQEQADCFAGAMVDELDFDTLVEMMYADPLGGDPFEDLPEETQLSLGTALLDCGVF